ncbi:MAG: FtsQ-type POTRA domain-containing protein [Verrucomicrobia bacterium]|nr:FtsQ-type POTRA domain-containing protein [Verrucomicrobiota bacterium]
MSTHANTNPPTRTWRDIQQSIAPKAMSSEGRKRLLAGTVKTVCVLFGVCLAGWGVYEAVLTWEKNPMAIKSPVKSVPVKTVNLRTDGVLEKAWVTRTLALPKSAGLMELDLQVLKTRLLESGQIRTVVLSRKFPDTLVVQIEERTPVARVRAQIGAALPKDYLVARDGVVYEGLSYDPALIGSLPYLGDVGMKLSRGRFQPIEGMDKVAELLSTAHVNIPALYRNWQIVSLARYESDGFIIVRSKEVKEITFDTRESDFFKQVALLDMVVAEAHLQPDRPARSVNLAIGESQGCAQVPVVLETAPESTNSPNKLPATNARPAAPSAHSAPQRPVLFTNLRLNPREF